MVRSREDVCDITVSHDAGQIIVAGGSRGVLIWNRNTGSIKQCELTVTSPYDEDEFGEGEEDRDEDYDEDWERMVGYVFGDIKATVCGVAVDCVGNILAVSHDAWGGVEAGEEGVHTGSLQVLSPDGVLIHDIYGKAPYGNNADNGDNDRERYGATNGGVAVDPSTGRVVVVAQPFMDYRNDHKPFTIL